MCFTLLPAKWSQRTMRFFSGNVPDERLVMASMSRGSPESAAQRKDLLPGRSGRMNAARSQVIECVGYAVFQAWPRRLLP